MRETQPSLFCEPPSSSRYREEMADEVVRVGSRKSERMHTKLLSTAVTLLATVLLSATVTAQEKVVIAYSGVSGFQGPLWTFNDLKLAAKSRSRS